MAIANRSSVNSIPTKVQLSPLAEIDLEEDPPTFHFPLIVFLASSGVCSATVPVASRVKASATASSFEEHAIKVIETNKSKL